MYYNIEKNLGQNSQKLLFTYEQLMHQDENEDYESLKLNKNKCFIKEGLNSEIIVNSSIFSVKERKMNQSEDSCFKFVEEGLQPPSFQSLTQCSFEAKPSVNLQSIDLSGLPNDEEIKDRDDQHEVQRVQEAKRQTLGDKRRVKSANSLSISCTNSTNQSTRRRSESSGDVIESFSQAIE